MIQSHGISPADSAKDHDPAIPGQASDRRYSTEDQQRIASLRKKLQYTAWLPGVVIAEKHREAGNGIWLLLALLCTCDWESGIWRGRELELATVLGVTERTVRNWLRRLKHIDVKVRRYPYSVAIYLPEWLVPNRQIARARERRTFSWRSEKTLRRIGNTADGPESLGSIMRRFPKPNTP